MSRIEMHCGVCFVVEPVEDLYLEPLPGRVKRTRIPLRDSTQTSCSIFGSRTNIGFARPGQKLHTFPNRKIEALADQVPGHDLQEIAVGTVDHVFARDAPYVFVDFYSFGANLCVLCSFLGVEGCPVKKNKNEDLEVGALTSQGSVTFGFLRFCHLH
jgi:ferredoxin